MMSKRILPNHPVPSREKIFHHPVGRSLASLLLLATVLFGAPMPVHEVPPTQEPEAVADTSPRLATPEVVADLKRGMLPIQRQILDMLAEQEQQSRPYVGCFAPGTSEAYMMAWYKTNSIPVGAQPFRPEDRWTSTASDGSGLPRGAPITLTWSVVRDGEPTDPDPSNLIAFLNGIYGSQAVWQPIMQQAFDRWSEVTGITYVYEANDSGAFPQAAGQVGVRGDVRVGGHTIDGPSGTLAYNYFPNTGDMIIDTADTFYNDISNNSLKFRNVFAHEAGHGIGLAHTCPIEQTKLMEPFATTQFDGPQHDDILSANHNYGDRFGLNHTTALAADLGTFADGVQSVTNMSIVLPADQDYYRFNTASGSRRVTVTVSPVGLTYLEGPQNSDGSCTPGSTFNSLIRRNLAVEVIDSNGTSVLGSASGQGAGVDEVLADVDLGGGTGPFYVRVFADSTDAVQMFNLTLNVADGTPQPEMAVLGNGAEIADGDTTPSTADATDLGNLTLGQVITNIYVITNTGTLNLTLSAPVISGAGAADYSLNPLSTTTLTPNQGTTMELVFSPTVVGTRDITISIDNNDFTENPYDFSVSGVGLSVPEIGVSGNGAVVADGSTTVSAANGTDFGLVDVLAGTATTTFVITNTGLTNLTVVTPVTISGAGAGDFTITTQPAGTVAAGGSTSFTILFDPTSIGTKDATVSFDNNDSDESPFDFAIRGIGSQVAEIAVGGNGQPILDGDLTPSAADNTDFGGAEILTGATVRSFAVTNLGSAPLTLSTPTISGAAVSDFRVTAAPATSLNPGATTSFDVTFDPIGAGNRNATVLIVNNDSDENPFDFAITGLGTTAPDIGLLGNALPIADGDTTPEVGDNTDFGGIAVGSGSVDRSFTITNEGSAQLVVSLPLVISGAGAGDFQVISDPATNVAVGGSTSFAIRFTPSAAGARNASVAITSDDADENPYNFDITGRGTVARINALGNGLVINNGDNTPRVADGTDFGVADVTSDTVIHTFTFTNTGDATLSLQLPAVITGSNAEDFQVTRSPASSLSPGASTDFDVQFNPSGTGLRTGILNMTNNDATANPFFFTVQGTGTGPDIEVFGNGFVVLDGSTTTTTTNLTDFRTNAVAGGRTTNTFVITNAGSGVLSLTLPITIVSNVLNDFQVLSQPATNSLLGGEFTTFDIVFDPVAGGPRTAVVNIDNDDSDENPFDFLISGLGDGPEISLFGNNLVITNGDVTPDILDGTEFGGADLNSGSVDRSFVITNEGTQPLTVTLPITLSGSGAGDFTVVSTPTATTLPGETNEFVVRFDPTETGARVATLTLVSDDGNEPNYRFDISGVGIVIPPTITSSPIGRNLNALEDVSLLVGANGTSPLTYYWYKDDVLIPNVNDAVLALNDVTLADAGLYHVVVSNVAGMVASSPAQITVNLLPSVVSWSNPATIGYGTPLGAGQLNATASVPGILVYSPSVGAVLPAGTHTLDVTFTPANPQVYTGSMASVQIVVTPAPLTLRADDLQRLVNTANPTLTYTASGFQGGDNATTLTPSPSLSTTAMMGSLAGTYPITFAGAAANPNYTITFVGGSLLVFEAAPAVIQDPIGVTTNALSQVSFNVVATGVAPLSYQWFKNGILLADETSSVLTLPAVTANDVAGYRVQVSNGSGSALSATANLTVNLLNPVITWPDPADVVYGTSLSVTQLNATANVGGSFAYTPDVGEVPDAGTHTLNATFTPTDTLNYNVVGGTATLVVTPASLVIRADNKTREFGLANPTFTFTPIGLQNGDTLAAMTTPPLGTTAADANSLPGNYAIVASGATSGNYNIAHSNGVLTVFANAPTIIDQPDSQTVVQGNPVSFAVVAGGTTPLSYQWRFAGTDIPGATAAVLTIPSVSPGDAGAYDVVVSNVGGSATSQAASLTVLTPPAIVQQPVAQSGTAAGSVNLSVAATGSMPLSYQWQKDGVDLLGQTSALLTLANLATSDVADYRVVISNEAGSVTSSAAAVTVTRLTPVVSWSTPAPIAYGTALAQSQLNATANVPGTFAYTPDIGNVPQGGMQNLSVLFTPLDTGRYEPVTENRSITVNPVPLTITANDASRELGTMNPAFGTSHAGFVNGDGPGDLDVPATVTTTAIQASPVGAYALVPGGAMSANYTFSYVSGTLTIVAVPVSIDEQPTSLIVTQGMDATFTVTADGSAIISYQWRKDGVDLPGEVAATLNITGAVAADDAMYDVVITNGANAVTSAVVSLDVLLPSTITWPAPANIVYGTLLGTNELNAMTGVPGTMSYTPDFGTLLPAGNHALNVAFAPSDTDTYLPTNATVNITVDPAPLTISADSKFREFGAANPALTASFSGFIPNEDFNVLTAQPMLSTTADLNTLPGDVPITISGATSPNYAINHVNGTLTVFANLPNITSAPGNLTVTNGDPVNLSVTVAGTAPLSLQWRFNGAPIANETNPTLTIAAAQPSDAGAYDIVVTNVAGMITSQPANLTVLVPPAIVVQPQSQTFSAFSDVTFTVTAAGTGPLQYQWLHNGQALLNQTNSVLNLTSVSPTDVGAYVVSVSNDAGTLNSDPATLSVNELAPDITWNAPAAITYGTALDTNQLNASTFVDGTFVYNPAAGTILASGTHTLNVTFNPADSTNFLSTNASVMITVDKAPLLVSADNQSREFNTANQPFNASFAGLVAGDNSAVLTAQPMISTTADINSPPGDYPINVSGATAVNYDITHSNATLTVFANAPNITQPPTNTFTTNGLDALLSVTATGTAPISFQWRKDGVDLTGATDPTYLISGAIAGTHDGAYEVVLSNIAGSVTSSVANLTVLVSPGIVTDPMDMTVDALSTNTLTVVAAGTAPLGYQWRKDGVDIPGATAATLILAGVTTNDSGVYSVVVSNGAGSVTSANAGFTVNQLIPTLTWADPAAIVYGTPLGTNQLNAIANTTGTFVYAPGAGTVLPVGAHPVPVAFTPDDLVNYVTNTAMVTVNVTPAPLQVRADDKSREFGTANPSLTRTVTGLVNGDTESVLTSPAVLSTSADISSGLGSYPILISGATADNYTVTHVAGQLTVFGIVPIVTLHPLDQTVAVGTDVSFTNAATGTTPLSYQWRKAGISLPGETNAILTISNVTAFASGSYDVVVTNVAGSVSSFAAVLNVLSPPNFVVTPTDAFVAIDQPILLRSLAAGSTPLNYQWYKDGVLLAGQTGVDLSISAANLLAAGDYWVVANNIAGVATSAVATVTVSQLPSLIQQPAPVEVNPGSPLTLSTVAFGEPPLTYQWLRNGVPQQTSASSTYFVPNASLVDVGLYEVIVTNALGQAQSQEFLVTLSGPPIIVQPPAGQVVLPGTNVVLEVIPSGSQPLTYLWQKNGQLIPGADGRTLSLTNITPADAGLYNVAVGNALGVVVSSAADITVITPPTILIEPTNQLGALGSTLTLSVSALSQVTPTYQWRFHRVPLAGATNSSLALAGLSLANQGGYDVVISNPAGSVTSQEASVTVQTPPTLLQQPVGATVNVGQNANFVALSTGTGPLNFQWMRDGVPIPGQTGSTLFLASVARTDQASYSVQVDNAVGSAISSAAPLRVLESQTLHSLSGGKLDHFRFHFGDQSGGLLTAADAAGFLIEASTNLQTWTVVSSNGVGLVLTNGSFRFEDIRSVILPRRYYRVREQ